MYYGTPISMALFLDWRIFANSYLGGTYERHGDYLIPCLTLPTAEEQIEFKVAEKDGQLGYYDILTPLYAAFHDDDKTFSLMWTEYHEDFTVFYQNYMQNQIQYGGNHV